MENRKKNSDDNVDEKMSLRRKQEEILKQINELERQRFTLRKQAEGKLSAEKLKESISKMDQIEETVHQLENELIIVDNTLGEFNFQRNFDKYICFSNIRELLKEGKVKIGQIEKDAGCQPGYMSRLDKPDNTSDPSIEFVVTAAKTLGVSLDSLIFIDLAKLTPTEKYLVNFLEKLNTDTLADKLNWNRETADKLNRYEADMNGYVDHPLFSLETFYEEGECEYPEEVTRIVFTSSSFGVGTAIDGDCFNLKMKNGSYLYLMDICKSVHKVGDLSAFAKEIWMYTPGSGNHLLACNKDATMLSFFVDPLFATVKERMKHPKIKKELQEVIDAFLQHDDVGEDDLDLPFA